LEQMEGNEGERGSHWKVIKRETTTTGRRDKEGMDENHISKE